jgi:hypothetical protein
MLNYSGTGRETNVAKLLVRIYRKRSQGNVMDAHRSLYSVVVIINLKR